MPNKHQAIILSIVTLKAEVYMHITGPQVLQIFLEWHVETMFRELLTIAIIHNHVYSYTNLISMEAMSISILYHEPVSACYDILQYTAAVYHYLTGVRTWFIDRGEICDRPLNSPNLVSVGLSVGYIWHPTAPLLYWLACLNIDWRCLQLQCILWTLWCIMGLCDRW